MTVSERPGEGPAPEETAVPAQSNAPDVAAAAVDGKQAIVLDGAPAPDEASAPGDATAPAPEQMTPLTSEEAPPATSSTGQPVLPGHGRHEAAPALPLSAWQTLGKALRPRLTMSQLVAALLCGLLGFALAVQLTADERSSLAGLRQNELVRILDEVTRRGEDLEQQAQTRRVGVYAARLYEESDPVFLGLRQQAADILFHRLLVVRHGARRDIRRLQT